MEITQLLISCHGFKMTICKNCGHTIMMAGGEYYHADKGFGRICKLCKCQHPDHIDGEKELT